MVSHCWGMELQIWKGRRIEWILGCLIGIGAISVNSQLWICIDRCRNNYRYVWVYVCAYTYVCICMYVHVCVCIYMYIHRCIPWLWQHGSSVIPIVMSTPTTYALVSKYHPSWKRLGALWRNGWFQGWGRESTGSVWNIFFQTLRTLSKTDVAISKGQRRWCEGTFSGQTSDNVSIKTHKNKKRL